MFFSGCDASESLVVKVVEFDAVVYPLVQEVGRLLFPLFGQAFVFVRIGSDITEIGAGVYELVVASGQVSLEIVEVFLVLIFRAGNGIISEEVDFFALLVFVENTE